MLSITSDLPIHLKHLEGRLVKLHRSNRHAILSFRMIPTHSGRTIRKAVWKLVTSNGMFYEVKVGQKYSLV